MGCRFGDTASRHEEVYVPHCFYTQAVDLVDSFSALACGSPSLFGAQAADLVILQVAKRWCASYSSYEQAADLLGD